VPQLEAKFSSVIQIGWNKLREGGKVIIFVQGTEIGNERISAEAVISQKHLNQLL
jgi:hypothetical protein